MTGVIGLYYLGQDPEHITQVLNNVLDVYHEQNIERKSLETKQTLAFLENSYQSFESSWKILRLSLTSSVKNTKQVDVNAESELLLKQNIDLENLRSSYNRSKQSFLLNIPMIIH